MAGQGSTTKAVARRLQESGWEIVYICVPNTPHIGVVPIPTLDGVSKQRYPDILAFLGTKTLLVEVEMTLNPKVAQDIMVRFGEHKSSLRSVENWLSFREHVEKLTNKTLPEVFDPECRLVLCGSISQKHTQQLSYLNAENINVSVFV